MFCDLLANISVLLSSTDLETESSVFDLPIKCSDGTIYWSRFLLAASSEFLYKVLQEDSDMCLIMPEVSKKNVACLAQHFASPEMDTEKMDLCHFEMLQLFRMDKWMKDRKDESSKTYKCTIAGCFAEFSRLRHYQRHKANHSKSNPLVCDHCGKVFYHLDNLKLHIQYHKDLKNIKTCEECQCDFYGSRALKAHVDHHHAPKVDCPVCQKSLRKRVLLRHLRSKHGKEIPERASLKNTLKKLIVNQEESVASEKGLPTSSPEKSAVQELIETQLNRVSCQHCTKTFSNRYLAKYHYDRVHLRLKHQRESLCSICDKKITGPPSRLARHMREVHAENRFECPECGHFFPVRASLERHLNTVHHAKKLECPFCHVQVVHISPHLSSSHGLSPRDAKNLANEMMGKCSARTNMPFE